MQLLQKRFAQHFLLEIAALFLAADSSKPTLTILWSRHALHRCSFIRQPLPQPLPRRLCRRRATTADLSKCPWSRQEERMHSSWPVSRTLQPQTSAQHSATMQARHSANRTTSALTLLAVAGYLQHPKQARSTCKLAGLLRGLFTFSSMQFALQQ